MTEVNDDTLRRTVYVVRTTDTRIEAAKILEIDGSTLRRRMVTAASRGLVDRTDWAPTVPEGFHLHRVSTYVNKDGEVAGQWFGASPDTANLDLFMEALSASLSAHTGKAEPLPSPLIGPDATDLLTVYNIGDHHLGMYTWAQETGADYDVDIAWNLLKDTMSDLVYHSPASETAIVLNLGDFFHTDNDLSRTGEHGNPLDTDTRYARVLRMGIDLTILTVQLALQKHGHVIYRALPGNHDPYASIALSLAVYKFFEREPRVTVDLDPSYFFVHQFGNVMLASTHGDKVKPEKFIGFMAAKWPKTWGATTYRYAYLGHVHHKSTGGEIGGAIWETFQTIAPKDSWHSQMGFMSHRSMTAITHHRLSGERFRTIRSMDWRTT